jgi:hypothetical protein
LARRLLFNLDSGGTGEHNDHSEPLARIYSSSTRQISASFEKVRSVAVEPKSALVSSRN